jgi:hypothetical protein
MRPYLTGKKRMRVLAIVTLGLLLGCGGGSTAASGSEAVCESNCDAQGAAQCAKTPASFVSDCKASCASSRTNWPGCVAELDRVAGCVATKLHWECDSGGVLQATPVGACSSEGVACINCTNDIVACGF